MLNMSVSKKLDNGNVLVVSNDINTPNVPKEYFSVKEEKADKFIKERMALETTNKFQKTLTTATAVVSGVLAAANVKSGLLIKGIIGAASGYGVYKAFDYCDDKINQKSMTNLLQRNNAQDITKNMIA